MKKTTPKAPEKTRAGVLVEKLQELGEITSTIALHARKLKKAEKAEIDQLEAEMTEVLQELLIEARIDEAEIKIGYLRRIVDVVKK